MRYSNTFSTSLWTWFLFLWHTGWKEKINSQVFSFTSINVDLGRLVTMYTTKKCSDILLQYISYIFILIAQCCCLMTGSNISRNRALSISLTWPCLIKLVFNLVLNLNHLSGAVVLPGMWPSKHRFSWHSLIKKKKIIWRFCISTGKND